MELGMYVYVCYADFKKAFDGEQGYGMLWGIWDLTR